MNYWIYIEKEMRKNPHALLCDGVEKISFGGVCATVEKLSSELAEECYAVLCRSKLACAIAALACEAAGKCAMILPYEYGERVCLQILERHCPSGIITDIYGGLGTVEISDGKSFGFRGYSPSVILHTSGSSGEKKGVMLDSENLMTNLLDIAEYFPITRGDRILIFRSLSHASAFTSELLIGLYRGADIFFYSDNFSPRKIIELIDKEKITVISGTPTAIGAMSALLREGECRSVRLINLSGERVTAGAAERIRQGFPNAKIFCGYGLTEASPRVAYLPYTLFDEKYSAAGIPLSSLEYKISPSGELLIKGRSVMRGYLGEAGLSYEKLRDGWLHTGDCAYIGDDGLLYIRGRVDDMINRAGINIYPAEIENELSKDKRVCEVSAYGFEADGEQRIGVKISGDFSDASELIKLCCDRLPAYMMPSKAELFDSVEMTDNGKIKRRA